MSDKRRYLNKSQQDIHLRIVGGSAKDIVILEPGATSPPVNISDVDAQFLVQTTGFLAVVPDPDPDPVPVVGGRIDPLARVTTVSTPVDPVKKG